MYPSQRSYLKSIVIGVGIRSFNVAGRAKQINIDKFVDLPGLMWTGPQFRPSRIGRANVSYPTWNIPGLFETCCV